VSDNASPRASRKRSTDRGSARGERAVGSRLRRRTRLTWGRRAAEAHANQMTLESLHLGGLPWGRRRPVAVGSHAGAAAAPAPADRVRNPSPAGRLTCWAPQWTPSNEEFIVAAARKGASATRRQAKQTGAPRSLRPGDGQSSPVNVGTSVTRDSSCTAKSSCSAPLGPRRWRLTVR
jgi:hypothetical protein